MVNLRHMNRNLNIFSTGTDTGLRICSNKFFTCQVLSEHGLRVPKQVLAHRPTDYKELIDLVGGLPCVAKLQRGSQGAGVFILNDRSEERRVGKECRCRWWWNEWRKDND